MSKFYKFIVTAKAAILYGIVLMLLLWQVSVVWWRLLHRQPHFNNGELR